MASLSRSQDGDCSFARSVPEQSPAAYCTARQGCNCTYSGKPWLYKRQIAYTYALACLYGTALGHSSVSSPRAMPVMPSSHLTTQMQNDVMPQPGPRLASRHSTGPKPRLGLDGRGHNSGGARPQGDTNYIIRPWITEHGYEYPVDPGAWPAPASRGRRWFWTPQLRCHCPIRYPAVMPAHPKSANMRAMIFCSQNIIHEHEYGERKGR